MAKRRSKPKSAAKQRRSRRRRIGVNTCLLGVGLSLGFIGPYLWQLDRLLSQRMAQLKPTPSTQLLARPLKLVNGAELWSEQLEFELNAAGYAIDPSLRRGSYRIDGSKVRIRMRSGQTVAFDHRDQLLNALSVDGIERTSAVLDAGRLGKRYQAGSTERQALPLGRFPALLVQGVQAVEDRRFKQHRGIDWGGIARASAANLRAGKVVQGGSTITQQLVKTLFFNGDRRWLRKFHEAALALLMERRFDKASILHAYLNEVFLGQSGNAAIHGFASASQYYFGLPVDQLRPHQVSLLVGLLKGPSYFNPWRNPQRAKQRRDIGLRTFYQTGLISNTEYQALLKRPLDVLPQPSLSTNSHPAFVDLVRHQVSRSVGAPVTPLTVQTTLSAFHQSRAELAVSEGLRQIERAQGLPAGQLQAALVLLERERGDVLAAVGGRERSGFNRALNARRPIGSIIKPFVFRTALRDGYTLASYLDDSPLQLALPNGEVWSPANFNQQSHGQVPMIEALAESYNQGTAKLGLAVGVDRVVSQLKTLGWPGHSEPNPSVLLGAVEMTPLEVAQLYLTLAGDNDARQINAVREVVDESGHRRQQPASSQDRLSPINFLLSFALRRAVDSGTGRGLAASLGPGIAGKTGTSNDLRDSWFVGYSADLLAVVWVGRDDNKPAGVTGASGAMQIFGRLFQSIPWRPEDPAPPASIEYAWIDRATGKLAANDCPDTDFLPFIEGTTPLELAPCIEPGTREPRRRRWWRFWR